MLSGSRRRGPERNSEFGKFLDEAPEASGTCVGPAQGAKAQEEAKEEGKNVLSVGGNVALERNRVTSSDQHFLFRRQGRTGLLLQGDHLHRTRHSDESDESQKAELVGSLHVQSRMTNEEGPHRQQDRLGLGFFFFHTGATLPWLLVFFLNFHTHSSFP